MAQRWAQAGEAWASPKIRPRSRSRLRKPARETPTEAPAGKAERAPGRSFFPAWQSVRRQTARESGLALRQLPCFAGCSTTPRPPHPVRPQWTRLLTPEENHQEGGRLLTPLRSHPKEWPTGKRLAGGLTWDQKVFPGCYSLMQSAVNSLQLPMEGKFPESGDVVKSLLREVPASLGRRTICHTTQVPEDRLMGTGDWRE